MKMLAATEGMTHFDHSWWWSVKYKCLGHVSAPCRFNADHMYPGQPAMSLPHEPSMDLPVIDLDLFLSQPRDSPEVIAECKKVNTFLPNLHHLIGLSGCRCSYRLRCSRSARFPRV